jgi:glycosyl transferase family 25
MLKTFVINLDRSPQRLSIVNERAKRVSLDVERVAGINGRELDLTTLAEVDIRGYQHWHGKRLNPNEVGCYLSHIKAMRAFLLSEAEYGLILEDDVDFPDDFHDLLQTLISVNVHWDIVKLSSFHSGTPIPIESLDGMRKLAVPLSRHMNANSILYNRKAAARLIQKLLPMRLPFDHALERAWLFGLKLRVVSPSPCLADTGLPSDIGYTENFKFPVYKRLGCFCFRTRTELSRVLFGLFHVVRHKFLLGIFDR